MIDRDSVYLYHTYLHLIFEHFHRNVFKRSHVGYSRTLQDAVQSGYLAVARIYGSLNYIDSFVDGFFVLNINHQRSDVIDTFVMCKRLIRIAAREDVVSVSYTHLTLPTICSV